jgi:serine/threonine-protein kinase
VTQVWGERYERPLKDVITTQADITRHIAANLRLQLTRDEQSRIAHRATANNDAYQLYLKALYLWNRGGPIDWMNALQHAQQAVEKDPEYAPPHAVAAISSVILGLFALKPAHEAFPKAKAAAFAALRIDERTPHAHTALALARLFYDWDWISSEHECRLAIDLDPADPLARYASACYSLTLGNFEEAERQARRGLEIDPMSMCNHVMLTIESVYAGKYDQAIQVCLTGLEIQPQEIVSLEHLALSYALQGRYDEAATMCGRLSDAPGGHWLGRALLGYTYALSGRVAEARAILTDIEQAPTLTPFESYRTAGLYAAMGEHDRAFALLDHLCSTRTGMLVVLKVFPLFRNLHADPRFERLIERIGIPA